jgi:probable O-glycosylation ligase (exosortase A-associated)
MRDIVLAGFLFGSIPFILWRPVIGVYLWVWVSVMNPHRMTYGFAHDTTFAMYIAIATLIGFLFTREPKRLLMTPVTVTLLLFTLWMCVTTYFAFDTEASLPMWERVMKIELMTFVMLFIVHSRRQIEILIWIVALSVAFYGIKGGIFTLKGGGELTVWGPPGSFIEDNNSLALAVIMTIPLLHYLYQQATNKWMRRGLLLAMLLCGFSVLGSYSRGGFVAIAAMIAFLWSRSRSQIVTGAVLVLLVPFAIGFMPGKWEDRMRTIEHYDQDASSMGRINAWKMTTNLANDRPLVGGGYEIYTDDIFSRYAPNPDDLHAAHSIYFQILGEHGYVGLAFFLMLWFLTWRNATWIMGHTQGRKELQWAFGLARMIQVSLLGYAVGGAFLSLAYYDVPYYLLGILVLTRVIVEREIKRLAETQTASADAQASAPGTRDERDDADSALTRG